MFDHIGISVRNLERSIDFYRDMFGLEPLMEPMPFAGEWFADIMDLDEPRGRLCTIAKDSLRLELFEFDHPAPAGKDPAYPVSDHGITHFGIVVDDIDEVHDRLRAAGVRFHCRVKDHAGGIRATYGRDMDGNVFELLELPKR